MEKILIILTLIVTGATSALASDWRWIDNGLYLDIQSITLYEGSYLYPHRNTYSFWSKIIYDGSQEAKNSLKGTNSIGIISNMAIDCDNKTFRPLSVARYDINNTPHGWNIDRDVWYPISSQSANMQKIYLLICESNKQ